MFKYFFTYLILFSLAAGAQISTRDSLLNRLDKAGISGKVKVYQDLAEHYKTSLSDSAIFFANKAIEASKASGDEYQLAASNRILGKIYITFSKYEAALPLLNQARNSFEKLKKEKELAEVLNELGLLNYQKSNYSEALGFYEKALTIGEKIDDKNTIGFSLSNIGDVYFRQNKSEEAQQYYLNALDMYEGIDNKDELAQLYNRLGSYYSSKSEFEKAIEYYKLNLEIRRESNYLKGIGIALNNIGNQYLQLGNFELAIENYKEASEIFKEIKFDRGTAATLTGMAIIYEYLLQFDAALEVYKDVLAIREKEGNIRELANTLSNIGVTYSRLFTDSLENLYGVNNQDTILLIGGAPDMEYSRQSLEYNLKALKYRTEIEDYYGLSVTLANLGNTYQYLGDFDKAREYFNRWLQLPEETRDDDVTAAIRIGLGKLAMYEGNYNTAIAYFDDALTIASRINKKTHIQTATQNLADLYEKEGNYEEALLYYKKYHNVFNDLNQEQTRDQIHEMQVKYETEAKEKENELLRKDQEISESKLKNSRRALITAIVVVMIFIVLVIQLIRQNTLRRIANLELERKNRLITEQTKEITDSIQYASRIQNAILPPPEIMNHLLPENLIVYRPRDIVSGDYFWITEKDNKIIIIVADCTGHGVPGAFMSMLGVAFLNEIVSKHEELHVEIILNDLRNQVIHSLHQTGKEGENQDGMDVALFIIDRESYELEYAGANNPLLIFRNNELIELKADKMPIGIHTHADKPFTRKEIKLKKGDMLYAFSDGYPDQFGGPMGKKYMIKNFRKLLMDIHKKSIKEQKQILEKSLDKWMANTKQIDDIIVMGVRI